MFFDDESQKPGQALVARETGALQDPFQLPPCGLRLRFERWHWFEHSSYFQCGASVSNGLTTPGDLFSPHFGGMVATCEPLCCSRCLAPPPGLERLSACGN